METEIVSSVPFLINFMEIKNTMHKFVNFVLTTSVMKRISSKILLQLTSKAISKSKGKMDSGVMISKFKPSLKSMQDQYKFMFLGKNPLGLFMSKMNKMFNL